MGTIARQGARLVWAVLAIVWLSAALSAPASGSAPDLVLRMPQREALPPPGSGTAQTNNARGVAANPDTGRVYVASAENGRINEYTAWGLFVKSWGWDVAPDGQPGDTASDELEACGPAVPEADPSAGLCQAGDEGAGKGQLSGAMGLAVDPSGNIYVYERSNRRVQKFSSAGEFLLMFGGDVNQTKVDEGAPAEERNVCGPTDICRAGISGDEPSQLDATLGDCVAYSPHEGGTILVGDQGGIQVFDLSGKYIKTIAFEGPLGAFAGAQVNGLDVDKDGNIYISLDSTEDLYKLSPSGEPLSPGTPGGSSFKAENPLGVAVDVEGSVYAIDDPGGLTEGVPPHVLKFSSAGEKLVPTAAEEEAGDRFPERTPGVRLTAIATNFCEGSDNPGNLYIGFFNAGGGQQVSYVDAYGTGPVGCEPPPPAPPIIAEQFTTFVGREEATVRASINPKFFQDATYYVEYGTGFCAAGGCPSKVPVPPAILTQRAVNAFIPTAGVILEGLAPGTTYHYRFVSQSSGGGSVFGTDPDGGGPLEPEPSNGLEATFTTNPLKGATPVCSNDAFRIGPGAGLPDCRAYEMVSPLEKGNADVALGLGRNNVPFLLFEVNQSALSGERFSFSAATAFAEARSAPFASQYLVERGAEGWTSEGISPPRTESGVTITLNFGAEYQGFTDDLCRGWLRLLSVAALVPEAVAKFPNLYRRENCAGPPAYTAITTKEPLNRPPEQYTDLLIKGFSADGSHTIFTAPDKLSGTGAPTPKSGERLLYERTAEGVLQFVCYLPNGKVSTQACSAGTAVAFGSLDVSSLHNAISADGSRIFWTAYSDEGSSHPGRIYVRIDGKETRAVSVPVSPDPAFFWTAADNGSKAIFQFISGAHKDELFEFDVDAEQERLISEGVEGPMGASEDASRIYFASTEDLDGAGQASVGDHNLYFYEADPAGGPGRLSFIMALPTADLSSLVSAANDPPSMPVSFEPALRAARVTPDGLHATFVSAASPTPTGYDNRDVETGKAATEVYRYDATDEELLCVSCNPTGARPAAGNSGGVPASARIQGWEALNHAPRVISDDGSRVFFESHEALVPEDSNGT